MSALTELKRLLFDDGALGRVVFVDKNNVRIATSSGVKIFSNNGIKYNIGDSVTIKNDVIVNRNDNVGRLFEV